MKVQVSTSAQFRKEVAEAIVKESHPGYSYTHQGGYYADVVEGKVYHKESQAAWNPWSDSATVVDVQDLVPQDSNDFSGAVDWKAVEIPSYRDMVEACLADQGEDLEGNGDIPEWVSAGDVVAFCQDVPEFQEELQELEQQSHQIAVEFALGEILNEVEIEE